MALKRKRVLLLPLTEKDASGTTPICDSSTREDATEASGHGPPIVLGTVIGLITKLQTHRYIEIQVSGERIQNHGQKGNVKVAKHMMGLIQQRAGGGNSSSKGGAAAYQYILARTG
jgi:hypothetical protein